MIDAQAIAREWVDAFNKHDLERVLSHYSDDIQLVSPFYLQFTAGHTDELNGISELRHYFGTALQRYPELRFSLLDVAEGSRGPCIRYHTNLGDRIAMEAIELDASGKATRVLCHYKSD
jgi:hypothetical protein